MLRGTKLPGPWLAGLAALVLVLGGVAIGAALSSGRDGSERAAASASSSSAASSSTAASPEPAPVERPALGRADAPVTVIEYADYQCPFCGKFARDTKPVLVERYVRTGKMRFEWHDFPYMGPQSRDTAVAARAAGRQGKYWAFHDAVFALALRPFSGDLTRSKLTELAAGVGVDLERFERDLADPELGEAVDADFQEGQSLGVNGTPTFVINGTVLVGAQPLDVFEQAIDAALAEAE